MDTFLQAVLSNAVLAGLLALAVGIVAHFVRRPEVAYWLWALVLLKLVTPPVIHVPIPLGGIAPPPGDVSVQQVSLPCGPSAPQALPPAAAYDPGESMSRGSQSRGPFEPFCPPASPSAPVKAAVGREAPLTLERSEASEGQLPAPGVQTPTAVADLPWRWILLVGWLTGSALWFALAAVRLMRFGRLIGQSQPAPEYLCATARHMCERMSVRGCPAVRVLEARVPPLLWCSRRGAVIVLPSGLLAQLPRSEQAALVAHELAHYRRRDHLARWITMLILGLYWWHPVVWWAQRRLRQAEEQCCDAWVVWALPGEAKTYAGTLLTAVEFLSRPRPSLPLAASGFGEVGQLKRRIEMILARTAPWRMSWAGMAALLILAAMVLPWSLRASSAQPAVEKSTAAAPLSSGQNAAAPPATARPAAAQTHQPISGVVQGPDGPAATNVEKDAVWPSPSDDWVFPLTGAPFDLGFIGAVVDVNTAEPTSGLPWDLLAWARDELRLTEDQQRKLRATLGKKTEEAAKAAADVLTPEQLARLKQLALQAKGLRVLTMHAVASALGITEQQRKLLEDFESRFQGPLKHNFDRQRAVMYDPHLSLQDIQAQIDKLRAEREKLAAQWKEAALAVLTPQQRADFASMKGVTWGALLEAKSRAGGLRHRRGIAYMFGFDEDISGLVWAGHWQRQLPLSQDQAKAIKSLDEEVLQIAGDQAAEAVAEKIEEAVALAEKTKLDPPDWHLEDAARLDARFIVAQQHAERMVFGLLTEQQARVVTRRDPSSPFYEIKYHADVQERLGLTEYQKQELDRVYEEAGHLAPPFYFHPVPMARPSNDASLPAKRAAEGRTDQAAEEFRNKGALKILTPSQRQIWDQMTTEPPKPAKPDFHAPTADEAAAVNLAAESQVFRILAEKPDAFGLNETQKQLLHKLEAIVTDGLYWISLRTPKGRAPSADVSRAAVDFVHEGEQVALLGILNEKQASSVSDAIANSAR